MKREIGTAFYFWVMVIAALLLGWQGKSVESAVMTAAAGIIGVLHLIARDYFDGAERRVNRRALLHARVE